MSKVIKQILHSFILNWSPWSSVVAANRFDDVKLSKFDVVREPLSGKLQLYHYSEMDQMTRVHELNTVNLIFREEEAE